MDNLVLLEERGRGGSETKMLKVNRAAREHVNQSRISDRTSISTRGSARRDTGFREEFRLIPSTYRSYPGSVFILYSLPPEEKPSNPSSFSSETE